MPNGKKPSRNVGYGGPPVEPWRFARPQITPPRKAETQEGIPEQPRIVPEELRDKQPTLTPWAYAMGRDRLDREDRDLIRQFTGIGAGREAFVPEDAPPTAGVADPIPRITKPYDPKKDPLWKRAVLGAISGPLPATESQLATTFGKGATVQKEGSLYPEDVGMFDWWQKRYFDPASAAILTGIQKSEDWLTGKLGLGENERYFENRRQLYREAGHGPIEAGRLAMADANIPAGARIALEIGTDPTLVMPGVGFGSQIAKAGRLGATAARAAAVSRPVQTAIRAPAFAMLGIPGQTGGIKSATGLIKNPETPLDLGRIRGAIGGQPDTGGFVKEASDTLFTALDGAGVEGISVSNASITHNKRKIVNVRNRNGSLQPFFKSTSDDQWYPFDGVLTDVPDANVAPGWFNTSYYSGMDPSDPLYMYGTAENKLISNALSAMGGKVAKGKFATPAPTIEAANKWLGVADNFDTQRPFSANGNPQIRKAEKAATTKLRREGAPPTELPSGLYGKGKLAPGLKADEITHTPVARDELDVNIHPAKVTFNWDADRAFYEIGKLRKNNIKVKPTNGYVKWLKAHGRLSLEDIIAKGEDTYAKVEALVKSSGGDPVNVPMMGERVTTQFGKKVVTPYPLEHYQTDLPDPGVSKAGLPEESRNMISGDPDKARTSLKAIQAIIKDKKRPKTPEEMDELRLTERQLIKIIKDAKKKKTDGLLNEPPSVPEIILRMTDEAIDDFLKKRKGLPSGISRNMLTDEKKRRLAVKENDEQLIMVAQGETEAQTATATGGKKAGRPPRTRARANQEVNEEAAKPGTATNIIEKAKDLSKSKQQNIEEVVAKNGSGEKPPPPEAPAGTGEEGEEARRETIKSLSEGLTKAVANGRISQKVAHMFLRANDVSDEGLPIPIGMAADLNHVLEGATATVGEVPSIFRELRLKATALLSWIDPAKALGREGQIVAIMRQRYVSSELQRARMNLDMMAVLFKNALGKGFFTWDGKAKRSLSGKIRFLEDAYGVGVEGGAPRYSAAEPHIGTLQDAMEYPHLYPSVMETEDWKLVRDAWQFVTDTDFDSTLRMIGPEQKGVKAKDLFVALDEAWYPHAMFSKFTPDKNMLPVKPKEGVPDFDVASREVRKLAKDSRETRAQEKKYARTGKPLPDAFHKRKLNHRRARYEFMERNRALPAQDNLFSALAAHFNVNAEIRADMLLLDKFAETTGSLGRSAKKGENMLSHKGMEWHFKDPQTKNTALELITPPDKKDMVSRGVQEFKAVLLNADLSIAGMRQNLLAFYINPIATLKANKAAFQYGFTPEGRLQFYVENLEGMREAQQLGLTLVDTPLGQMTGAFNLDPSGFTPMIEKFGPLKFINEYQFSNILAKLKYQHYQKLVSHLYDMQAQRDFSWLPDIPGLQELFRKTNLNLADMTKMSDAELKTIAADAVNNYLGGIERARWAGKKNNAFREIAILTENWTRAQVGLAINATKLTPKGAIARRMIAAEATFGMLIAAFANAVTGAEPIWDPRHSDFGKINIPGYGKISFLPHQALYRVLARTVAGIPEDQYGADESPAWQRVTGIQSFGAGRTGQGPSVAIDLIRGRDFMGREIDNLHLLKEIAPIPVQNFLDAYERDGLVTALYEAGPSILGTDVQPEGWKNEMQRLVHERYPDFVEKGTKWEDIPWRLQGQAMMSDGGSEIDERYGQTQSKQVRDIERTFYAQQRTLDKWLTQGFRVENGRSYPFGFPEWTAEQYKLSNEKRIRKEQARESLGLNDLFGTDEQETLMGSYYDLMEEFIVPSGDPESGEIEDYRFDSQAWNETEELFLSELSEDDRNFVKGSVHKYDTPEQHVYRMGEEVMSSYASAAHDEYERWDDAGLLSGQQRQQVEGYLSIPNPDSRRQYAEGAPFLQIFLKSVDRRRALLSANSPLMNAIGIMMYGRTKKYFSDSKLNEAWTDFIRDVQAELPEPVVAD